MKSATAIGRELGLGARELNFALKEAGLQAGKPGAWSLTELGKKYAVDHFHHRGTGGYSHMNREWDVRVWDESVIALLGDMTADRRRHLREAVAAASRATRAAGTELAPAIASSLNNARSASSLAPRTAGAVTAVVAGAVVLGIYRAGSTIKQRRLAAKAASSPADVASDPPAEPLGGTDPA